MPPTTLTRSVDAPDFNHCAWLLVWAWRLIVTGRADCPLLRREFCDACCGDDQRVLSSLCGFLCTLARTRRQRLQVNHPGCLTLTSDETRMLAMLAAAQDNNDPLLRSHLSWIARPGLRGLLEESVYELAASLSVNHLQLPPPPRRVPGHRGWRATALPTSSTH